ncbi:MAG: HD family phosphohydrolase [Treponema sp.]
MKKNRIVQNQSLDSENLKKQSIYNTASSSTLFDFKTVFGEPCITVYQYCKHLFSTEKTFAVLLCISFLIAVFANIFIMFEHGKLTKHNLKDFEVGKVAEQDITASKDVTYTDKAATEVRRTALMQLITPVFRQSDEVSQEIVRRYGEFQALILALQANGHEEAFISGIQKQYPDFFTENFLHTLFKVENLTHITEAGFEIIKQALAIGIIDIPPTGLEKFNTDELTLLVQKEGIRDYINVQPDSLIRIELLGDYIRDTAISLNLPADDRNITALVFPFLRPTVTYDDKETQMRIKDTVQQVPPVTIHIQKNQRIIKRGFIITSENYKQLQAYINAGIYIDMTKFFSLLFFLLCLYAAGLFTFSEQVTRQTLKESQKIFLLLMFVFVYLWVLFTAKFAVFELPLDMIPVIPAALTAMLVLTLISKQIASISVFYTALLILAASGFKLEPALFAFFSGLAAVSLMNVRGKRMDLITTGCQLACANPVITAVLIALFSHSYTNVRLVLISSIINGFISGILVLGLLPIFEDRMNTPTCFRLQELADTNSPVINEMLLKAAGTYHHTTMVAKLAELACNAIGADALLARVGALYHDIGKIKNSDYFVENQTSYNKHLDLNPRMSATIIRSHVSSGVETAEKMRLPQEVIDIISEHHGNSLVYYFYAKAQETDSNVSPIDFSYPGQPPRSKESAVVMLADMTEAACRSLDNPSFSRLEKFIGNLIQNKIESGQLDNSDLTFRELKIIESCFIDTLTGYYHNRIKYPNQKDPDEIQEPAVQEEAKEIPAEVKNYIAIDLGLEPEKQGAKQEGTHA